jgi:hypothetical protein
MAARHFGTLKITVCFKLAPNHVPITVYIVSPESIRDKPIHSTTHSDTIDRTSTQRGYQLSVMHKRFKDTLAVIRLPEDAS